MVRKSTYLATPMARAYAKGNMIARVRIDRPTSPVFDPVTGELGMGPDETIYEGMARVASVQGPTQYFLGDEPQAYSNTLVSIPIEATKPRVDDVVEVLAHPDLEIIGRFFRVLDVEAGGHMPVVHRMQVVGIAPSRQWEEV